MQRHPVNSANSLTHLTPFTLGSVEWAALPDMDVPAILAKIDTGARTSALHAESVEVFQAPDGPRVRFVLTPVAGRRDIKRHCDAPLIARRWVTSSNGGRELRCVVSTTVEVGDRRWPVEVTLTNRGRMRYRMLLGQRAILADMAVVPNRKNRQRVIGYGVYGEAPRRKSTRPASPVRPARPRLLSIGLIGEGPVGPAWQMLADAASAQGHVVERIDVRHCRLLQDDGRFRIESAGRIAGPLDAVLAMGTPCAAAFLPNIVRHAELAGAAALNGAEALTTLSDPARTVQMLWSVRIPTAITSLPASFSPLEALDAGASRGRLIRGLVIDGKIVASDEFNSADLVEDGARPRLMSAHVEAHERRTMVKVARALRLGAVRIDLLRLNEQSSVVAGIDASPSLMAFARLTETDLGLAIIKAIERRADKRVAPTQDLQAAR